MLNNIISAKTEYQLNPLNSIKKGDLDLISLLKAYSTLPGWILLIAPEGCPTKDYLIENSIDVNKVIVFQKKHCQDVFYTANEAVKHHTCSAVIFWDNAMSEAQQRVIFEKGSDAAIAIHSLNVDNIDGILHAH
ncbi:hypothetical protein [Psychrosphaera aestuarii]|uniref:hypothetical protein n=1 Tax=Psychrosphaera aestuarii TaxID=1266052 RepID=UPI001B32577C|nr:hypothetical protein [Psychrosphaera aestuarii]